MVMPVSAPFTNGTTRLLQKTAHIATQLTVSVASKPAGMLCDKPGISGKATALPCMQRRWSQMYVPLHPLMLIWDTV